MKLDSGQRQRAVGAVLAMATGDALGAGYEFGPALAADHPVGMIGGGFGPFAPGEWTDDPGKWTDDPAMCVAGVAGVAASRGQAGATPLRREGDRVLAGVRPSPSGSGPAAKP